jgi:hypothetical protein
MDAFMGDKSRAWIELLELPGDYWNKILLEI